ncbi:MAG: hypothetical protein WDN48_15155 [Pseudolabrys sp.]
MKPGAARKAQQNAEQQDACDDEIDDADAARHHAIEHHQRWPNQERAKDVRILEAAKGAAERREEIGGPRHKMKIAGNAGERNDGCRRYIGGPHGAEPKHGVFGEQKGEHDRCDRKVDRRGCILDIGFF